MTNHINTRSTGIDWIPRLPTHWDLIRSKYLFSDKSIKKNENESLLSVTQSDGVVVRDTSDLRVWNPSGSVAMYKLIEPGDFVISLRSFEGGLELSDVKGIVSPAYTVLEPIRKLDKRFFRLLMKSHQFIIELNKNITGIRQGKTIGWDGFSEIFLPFPPLHEQALISSYLEKKISQIDSLIEKIEQKTQLLKEQRTSLINQCVTKGLNADVEMKDSGVEWIGEIPGHWKVKRLKHFSSVELSSVDRHIVEDEIPVDVCHYTQVYRNEKINKTTELSKGTCTPQELKKFSLFKGDILLTKDSESPDDIGIPTFIEEMLEDTVCGYHLCHIRVLKKEINPEFVYRFIESTMIQRYFSISSNGVTRFGLGKPIIENMPILLPPPVDQQTIADEISRFSTLVLSTISKETKRIKLLKEYRQSLISNVVTGKMRITEEMI